MPLGSPALAVQALAQVADGSSTAQVVITKKHGVLALVGSKAGAVQVLAQVAVVRLQHRSSSLKHGVLALVSSKAGAVQALA